MNEARPTDIQACYVESCQNNNVLDCDLLRITIGTDGRCMNYVAIDTTLFPEEPTAAMSTGETATETETEPGY